MFEWIMYNVNIKKFILCRVEKFQLAKRGVLKAHSIQLVQNLLQSRENSNYEVKKRVNQEQGMVAAYTGFHLLKS